MAREGRRGTILIAALCLLGLACSEVVVLELPDPDGILGTATPLPRESVVLDADGGVLAVLRRRVTDPISLTEVPLHVVDAVLTAEDRRFHHHRGVDLRSVSRAALANVAAGGYDQGGSTITQQLVKTRYMPGAPRTPEVKLREAVAARALERRQSKAEILEDYLNHVYFGHGAYGIGAAADHYFGRTVGELAVHEAALLAAILRAPETLSPRRAPEAARVRRDDVLWRMAADGHITTAQRRTAVREPITLAPPPRPVARREPHVVDAVVRALLDDPRLGPTVDARAHRLYEGGLRIHTTISPAMQELARQVLHERLGDDTVPDAALVAIEPATGHVRAVVSTGADGRDFDPATQARRQPGSTFKVFVLAAAVADGRRLDDVVDGRAGTIVLEDGTPWQIRNADGRSHPEITIGAATRASVNGAFVRLGLDIGIERVARTARAMGVTSDVPADDPQITIGGGRLGVSPLEMAGAIGTLGNDGVHVPPTFVARVTDEAGAELWTAGAHGRVALSRFATRQVRDALEGVVASGTGTRARVPGHTIAGKTGTTNDHTDAWFVGTTDTLATAVWLGHTDARIPMRDVAGTARVTGGSIPAELFAAFMTQALATEVADDGVATSDPAGTRRHGPG